MKRVFLSLCRVSLPLEKALSECKVTALPVEPAICVLLTTAPAALLSFRLLGPLGCNCSVEWRGSTERTAATSRLCPLTRSLHLNPL